ncbi:MAG: bi-domain-containing oxidoreductase, partial [Pirellulales bacterium]
MQQIVQNLKTGQLKIDDVPPPLLREQGLLVRNRASLVSAGTERMMMELAKKSLVGKARERPDLVRKVLDKLRRDGFLATLQTVREKLDREAPMGYSACGEVVAVGARAREFQPGQLVACAGAGHANHAEVNYIPRLLAARVPEGVAAEAAAYTTVGTIALQGVRNADVRFGETVLVLGLGLIGQLTVQILRSAGCRVLGLDLSPQRVELAAAHGADLARVPEGEQTDSEVMAFTRGRGADAVLITAATDSNAPVEQAARLARDRARVVMVGVTGMDLPRRDYFQKELSFVVSRSYGPGRYDSDYEEGGHDYPVGYVRWTENRNMEAFLDLLATGGVRPEVLTTHRFPIDRATEAMQLIIEGSEPHLGVVLTYPEPSGDRLGREPSRIELPTAAGRPKGRVGVSLIGAGGFARATHLPNLRGVPSAIPRMVCDADGLAARSAAAKYGFTACTSSQDEVLADEQTDLVIVTTPHSRHAEAICRVVEAGKAAFVEKPLAISSEQLAQVVNALKKHEGRVMVGFNRRFSPLAVELKDFLAGRGPMMMQYRCNAGPLPAEHWISDPAEGGRIIGEACHFFD